MHPWHDIDPGSEAPAVVTAIVEDGRSPRCRATVQR